MAIFSPGPAVESISGALSGAVFVNARGSKVIRRQPTNHYGRTADQLRSQAILQRAYTQWKGLTDAQRLQWTRVAQENPLPNRLGQHRPITGYQLWVMLFAIRTSKNDIADPQPPVPLKAREYRTIFPSFSASGAYNITTTHVNSSLAGLTQIWLARSFRFGETRNFHTWKYFGAAPSWTGTANIKAVFEALLGPLAVGERYAVRLRIISEVDNVPQLPAPPYQRTGVCGA